MIFSAVRRLFAAALFVTSGIAQYYELGDPLRWDPPKQTPPPAAAADFAIPAASWYDTSSRSAVAQAYIGDYLTTRAVPSSWTGNVAAGNAGDVSQAYRNAVAQRVNWYRAMAGVPAWVSFNATFNAKAQKGALMLAANKALSHTPPVTWQFYTAEGAEALGKSNLCRAFESDPGCVEQYIADQGANNTAAGHRRWILYPQTKLMGTGDIPYDRNLWNALWIIDGTYGTQRPATRDEFVAWPPKGYVPYQVIFPRWSFSYPNANFSAASVTMTRGGANVPLRVEPAVAGSFGENTIVWIPDNQSVTDWLNPNPPATDTTYTVTIGNVLIGDRPRSFTYETTVFDPGAGAAFTADPPVSSFGVAGGDGVLRILKDPPATSATAVGSATWITLQGGPVSNPSGTYFFYTVAANTGAPRTGTITVGNAVHTINQAGNTSGISVNRTSVPFGTVTDRTLFTRAQDVQVNFTGMGAPASWTASSNQPWLSVTPAGGTGSGAVTLSLVPLNIPPAGTYTAIATIAAGTSSQEVTVPLTVKPPAETAAPFGVIDEPRNGETNRHGAIGVTGWALDDIEVSRVSLWRKPTPGEPVHSNGHVYIGDAVFLEGARPDVAAAYPSSPLTRAAAGACRCSRTCCRTRTGGLGRATGRTRCMCMRTTSRAGRNCSAPP